MSKKLIEQENLRIIVARNNYDESDEDLINFCYMVQAQQKNYNTSIQNIISQTKYYVIVYDKKTDKPVACGALKRGKNIEYSFNKANVLHLLSKYHYELGYFLILEKYRGNFIEIEGNRYLLFIGLVLLLIKEAKIQNEGICFTMEETNVNKIKSYLIKKGFRQLGNSYQSIVNPSKRITLWGNKF